MRIRGKKSLLTNYIQWNWWLWKKMGVALPWKKLVSQEDGDDREGGKYVPSSAKELQQERRCEDRGQSKKEGVSTKRKEGAHNPAMWPTWMMRDTSVKKEKRAEVDFWSFFREVEGWSGRDLEVSNRSVRSTKHTEVVRKYPLQPLQPIMKWNKHALCF